MLPDGLESIGECCFLEDGFRSVTLPPSVRRVGAGAFSCCFGLESVRLNDGLEVLGDKSRNDADSGVFRWSSLKEITFPSSLRELGEDTFRSCE